MSISTDAIARRAVLQSSDKTKAYKKPVVPGSVKAPPLNQPQPRDTMSQSAANIKNRTSAQGDVDVNIQRPSLKKLLGY